MGLLLLSVGTLGSSGCAKGEVITSDDGGPTSTTSQASTGSGAGGSDATGGMGGAGGEEEVLPCGIDCSTIETPQCSQAVCNETTKMCEVVNLDNGTACDDDLFCTINDTCQEGECLGGPENDCGLVADQCQLITCDEVAKQCVSAAGPDGSACSNPNDLCQVNLTCLNGLCTGGTPMDCFFAPVPNECYNAVCNPMNGMCEPIPGNDGSPCVDTADLCTVNKTCSAGMCLGGNPMDCSNLTSGCNLGVCDPTSGQCTTQAVMNGDPCDDLDACTVGETCGMGQCTGGTPITQCVNADGCCPMGCTEAVDDDCSCNVNLATTATPSTNGGGSGGYGPTSLNNGVDEMGCQSANCSGCFTWISNSTSPAGDYIQYDWASPVQIGSMYLDLNTCGGSGCSGSGRGMASGEVQYWDGAQWVTAQTVSNNTSDVSLTFMPKLNTTAVRVFNMTAVGSNCGQASNTLVYEWYVWPGSNCQP